MTKRILVNGAGGFIGGHLVRRLKAEGYWVRAVDLKRHEFTEPPADEFIIGDLRDQLVVREVVQGIDEVYQLAADMGGAGYVFTGEHDADIMHNSATINLNCLEYGRIAGVKKFFYSSSACMYPEYNQLDPRTPKCSEDSAYPAAPDSEYGWEKLFSERLYLAYMRNYWHPGRASPVSTISSALKAHGMAAAKRLRLPSAAKWPRPPTAARSRSGGMASRPARSSTSTSAWKASAASWTPISPARSTSAPRKWSPLTSWLPW